MKKILLRRPSNKSESKPKRFFKHKSKSSPVQKTKKKKILKFPHILRIITEKYFLASLVSFVLVVIIIIAGLDLYKDIKEQQKIEKERQEIISKIKYWQEIVNKYKDYRDAYFQLAILEYRLKNFDKAKFYLDKSLSIDPNFEKGRTMEKILQLR